MIEDRDKGCDEGVQPSAEGAMVDEFGDLNLFEPKNRTDGVNDPAGAEISLPDVGIDELDDGFRVIQPFHSAEMIKQPTHRQALARIAPGGVVHPVPLGVEDLGAILLGHQRDVIVFAAPESDPDFVDDSPHQGLENLNFALEGQQFFIPPCRKYNNHRDVLPRLDLLHALPVHRMHH